MIDSRIVSLTPADFRSDGSAGRHGSSRVALKPSGTGSVLVEGSAAAASGVGRGGPWAGYFAGGRAGRAEGPRSTGPRGAPLIGGLVGWGCGCDWGWRTGGPAAGCDRLVSEGFGALAEGASGAGQPALGAVSAVLAVGRGRCLGRSS